MTTEIRICPHCNVQMRHWKEGDYLPDFADVDRFGKPFQQWWVCPGTAPYVCRFVDSRDLPTHFLARWRDKKWKWHNLLRVDLAPADRVFEPMFWDDEEEARKAIHEWATGRPEVDLVSVEKAFH